MTARIGFRIWPRKLRVPAVRDAVYAWLLARQSGEELVAFMDDTGVPPDEWDEWAGTTVEALRWLGLTPLQEVCFTSEARGDFRRVVYELVESGHAYRDFQEDQEDSLRPPEGPLWLPGYRGRDRDLPRQESNHRARAGQRHTVRFKVPQEKVAITDLVRGRTDLPTDDLEDFLLLLADGSPTSVLALVLSTAAAGIERWVCSAQELRAWADPGALPSTLLHRAMGRREPRFVILPDIRRDIMPGIEGYWNLGFPADAVINYLALLGWSSHDGREDFNRDELVRAFSLERVSRKQQKLNPERLLRLVAAHGGKGEQGKAPRPPGFGLMPRSFQPGKSKPSPGADEG